MKAGELYLSIREERHGAVQPIIRTCIKLKAYLGNDVWLVDLWLRNTDTMNLFCPSQVEFEGSRIFNNFVKVSNFSE